MNFKYLSKLKKPPFLIYGYLCAIAATIFWSGNFTVARGVSESIPPITLAFWRWTTAVVLLAPFAIRAFINEWGEIKNNFPYLIITSVLGVSLFNTLIYIAGHSTTAMNMSLIVITFPVFVIIISKFVYQEEITINKGLGIILVISGVLTLISQGDFSVIINTSFSSGDLWMLLAAITFATYSILVKHKPKQLGSRAFQISTFGLGLIMLTPFYILESSNTGFQIQSFNQTTMYSIVYLGLFASLFSYFLWSKSVEIIGPTKSSIVYYTLPIYSGIVAYIFIGETIELLHIVSMLLILFGVIIALYNKKKI